MFACGHVRSIWLHVSGLDRKIEMSLAICLLDRQAFCYLVQQWRVDGDIGYSHLPESEPSMDN